MLTLQEQDTAFALLSKELDNTKSELKSTKHALQCFEKRFLKLQEELEATKVKLCAANDSEKIIRNTARLDRSSFEKQLRDLRRDKNSLSKDFKKQLILIGNLREELVRLEKQRLFEISDPDDIVKILNWKLEAEEWCIIKEISYYMHIIFYSLTYLLNILSIPYLQHILTF